MSRTVPISEDCQKTTIGAQALVYNGASGMSFGSNRQFKFLCFIIFDDFIFTFWELLA